MELIDGGVYDNVYVTDSKPISVYLDKMTPIVNKFGTVIPFERFYEEDEKEPKNGFDEFISKVAAPITRKNREIVEAYKVYAKRANNHYSFYSPYVIPRGSKIKIYHRDGSSRVKAIVISNKGER